MRKTVIRTGDEKGVFARAKAAARNADRGERLDKSRTFSFKDPAQMFAILSEARRKLMQEVMTEPKSTSLLVQLLHRDHTEITRDIEKIQEMVLLISLRQIKLRTHGLGPNFSPDTKRHLP